MTDPKDDMFNKFLNEENKEFKELMNKTKELFDGQLTELEVERILEADFDLELK